jgi:hypothetical protein
MNKLFFLIGLVFISVSSLNAAKINWKTVIEENVGTDVSIDIFEGKYFLTYNNVRTVYEDGQYYNYFNFGVLEMDKNGNLVNETIYEEDLTSEIEFTRIINNKLVLFADLSNPHYQGYKFIGSFLYEMRDNGFKRIPEDTSASQFNGLSHSYSVFHSDDNIYYMKNTYSTKYDTELDTGFVIRCNNELVPQDTVILKKKDLPNEYAAFQNLLASIHTEDDCIVGTYPGPDTRVTPLWRYAQLAKFKINGDLVWSCKLQDTTYDNLYVGTITDLPTGNFLVYGTKNDTVKGKTSFLTEVDKDGNIVWNKDIPYEEYIILDTKFVPCAQNQLYAVSVYRNGDEKGKRNLMIHFFDLRGNLVDSALVDDVGEGAFVDKYMTTSIDGNGVVVYGYDQGSDPWSEPGSNYVVEVIPDIVSVEDAAAAPGIEVFPNPATDQLNIKFAKKSDYSVRLLDILGNAVLESEIKSTDESKINTGKLAKGFYILEIIDDSERKSIRKVIIE